MQHSCDVKSVLFSKLSKDTHKTPKSQTVNVQNCYKCNFVQHFNLSDMLTGYLTTVFTKVKVKLTADD